MRINQLGLKDSVDRKRLHRSSDRPDIRIDFRRGSVVVAGPMHTSDGKLAGSNAAGRTKLEPDANGHESTPIKNATVI